MKELEPLFLDLIDKSKKLILNERKRANIFLGLGILIAFSGVYYFILVTDPDNYIRKLTMPPSEIPETLLELTNKEGFYSNWFFSILPKTIAFGFIEYFAFFFFKLYKISQNTINNHIDTLKVREENFVVFSFYLNQNKEIIPDELFSRLCFFYNSDIVKSNEISKSLEIEKLSSNDLKNVKDILSLLNVNKK